MRAKFNKVVELKPREERKMKVTRLWINLETYITKKTQLLMTNINPSYDFRKRQLRLDEIRGIEK